MNRWQSVDYPQWHDDPAGSVSVWQDRPGGGIDPAAKTIRRGVYTPTMGPIVETQRMRYAQPLHPEPTAEVATGRGRWRAGGASVPPVITSGRVTDHGYDVGRAGSIIPPHQAGAIPRWTGGGGGEPSHSGGAAGGSVGGGPYPSYRPQGTWLVGTPALPTLPDDHGQVAGTVPFVAPMGYGGPGVLPGGGTGVPTVQLGAHQGHGQVETKRTGPTPTPGRPAPGAELVAYTNFGLPELAPPTAGITERPVAGGMAGYSRPTEGRPSRKPSNTGAGYQRPFAKLYQWGGSTGAKVNIKDRGAGFGPGAALSGSPHASTPIMQTVAPPKTPGYSGPSMAPAGMLVMESTRRNGWRVRPQPWDIPITGN